MKQHLVFDADLIPKPHPDTYGRIVERLDLEPSRAVMVEDMARNLEPAAALGMTTVWVRTGSPWGEPEGSGDYVDHETTDLVAWLEDILAG